MALATLFAPSPFWVLVAPLLVLLCALVALAALRRVRPHPPPRPSASAEEILESLLAPDDVADISTRLDAAETAAAAFLDGVTASTLARLAASSARVTSLTHSATLSLEGPRHRARLQFEDLSIVDVSGFDPLALGPLSSPQASPRLVGVEPTHSDPPLLLRFATSAGEVTLRVGSAVDRTEG